MARVQDRKRLPQLERLETRLQHSAVVPANSIGTSLGAVPAPGGQSAASVTIAPKNLTVGKSSTLFGIFVEPAAGSVLAPRIAGVRESDGQRLRVKQGRPYLAGRDDGQAAAFVKVNSTGPLTVLIGGQHDSTGSYQLDVTLAGDVNGDGTVNQADLQPFAAAYESVPGSAAYDPAADFNQNGIVNLYDAKALMRNMPAPKGHALPLSLVMNLLPADQAHYSTPSNSGGATFKKNVTIVGRTLPGSVVLEDNSSGYYKWDGPAFATNSSGYFTVPVTMTEGINNFNFLVLDPFGRQLIRSYPIFWLPFAAPGSKLK
jgi:hypothetical protein